MACCHINHLSHALKEIINCKKLTDEIHRLVFSNGVGSKRIIRATPRSVGVHFLPSSQNKLPLFLRYSTSRLRDLQVRMVLAKDTPTLTLKWEFGIRHSALLTLYDDVLDSWNLCLFIWLSWTLWYWAGFSAWSLISLINPI